MMNPLKYLIVPIFALLLLSCSDGSQIGNKINELIKLNKVTSITVETTCAGSDTESQTFEIKDFKMDQQFIKVGNEYINMGKIKSVSVDGKKMKIQI